jgi:type IV pilus assembly protein PilM
VGLTRKGKEITLERFALGEIPSSVFAAGRVAEPAELGARIKEILKENGVIARKAIISLSGKAAITRIIELPKMGAAQTRQAISLQINQYVPFPPGDTVYDYRVLPPREGANPSMQEVLLVATRATTVDSLIATLRGAGMEADGIKITSLAAWNLLETGLAGYSQGVGVIDVRDTMTDLSFFLNGQFRMSRPVELGYNTILGKVAQLLGVTPGEAEEYLKTDPVDLTVPEDEIDPTEDNRLREALLSVFSNFVSELIRSIRYYESQAQRSERVGKLILFGNISLFPNLERYLEDQTGLEVSIVSLGSLVQYRQGQYSLDFLDESALKLPVACGLCLEHYKRKKDLNLMPATYYTKSINATIIKLALVLFAFLAAAGWYYHSQESQKIQEQRDILSQREQEASRLKPDADRFDQVKSEIQAQQPRYKQIFSLLKNQRVWPEIMTELGNRINDQVWLESVDFEASTNSIEMTGVAVQRVDYLQFAINLDKSPFFTNTSVEEKTSGGGGGGGGGGGTSGSQNRSGAGMANAPAPDSAIRQLTMTPRPAQSYRLPRFPTQPGMSIEDFFLKDYIFDTVIIWEFSLTTELQSEIVDQSAAWSDLMEIEEVTEDVLQT